MEQYLLEEKRKLVKKQKMTRNDLIWLSQTARDNKNSRIPYEFFDLDDTNLSGLDLSGIDFTDFQFVSANFQNANLRGTIFFDALLNAADFRNANLENADFRGRTMMSLKLGGANLHGTRFPANPDGADLNIRDLEFCNLEGAIGLPSSIIEDWKKKNSFAERIKRRFF